MQALPDTPTTVVELGAWKGQSAACLGVEIINSGKPITMVCVDTFKGSAENRDQMADPDLGRLEAVFRENTGPVAVMLGERFRVIVGDSAEAANGFDAVDAVWIDACHTTGAVMRDIDAWWPKLKPGGIMGGDDWDFGPVQMAVRQRFPWIMVGGDYPWWVVRKERAGAV